MLPAYRQFHRDLLWHQSDAELWRPLFLGRAFEAILAQGGPWDETERIVAGALETLNDYIGYRPVAVLESEQQIEPYAHERVRPIPLYVQRCRRGLRAVRGADRAGAGDSRARPIRKSGSRPGSIRSCSTSWRSIRGPTSSIIRPASGPTITSASGTCTGSTTAATTAASCCSRSRSTRCCRAWRARRRKHAQEPARPARDELLFEAAAVLAGTILMASGTTGSGPGCHGSDVTLSTLLPHIAAYRDQFYEELLAHTAGPHGERLRAEAQRTRQPFGGARQHLNHELARRRATQMQHVHLAQLYARMGYPEAALAEAHTVRIASARMLCQIYCRLTAGHQAIDADQLEPVARYLPEIEDLLQRGIECGALVDPWNIVGFGGNFSLFPAVENTVHDFRVDDLIELVEQILDLCARAWTEAAAVDDAHHEAGFLRRAGAARRAGGTSTPRPASAASSGSWARRSKSRPTSWPGRSARGTRPGAAAGDVKFWRMFVDQFDSPKAFQLVVEALLERGDQVASMALMMQWVSQVERTPLEDGDASFHPLALRWLRAVEDTRIRHRRRSMAARGQVLLRIWKPAPRRTGTCPSSSCRSDPAGRRGRTSGSADDERRRAGDADRGRR